jgi:hypothetical protein
VSDVSLRRGTVTLSPHRPAARRIFGDSIMSPRRPRGHRGRFAAALIGSAPLPALAAEIALSAWGAYLFFAIVATVVIVLLLHEALEDESTYEHRLDKQVRKTHGREAPRDAKHRRIA